MKRLFVLIFLCGNAFAETIIEAGPSSLSGGNSGALMVLLNERIGEKWLIGIGYVGPQYVHPSWEKDNGHPGVDVGQNAFVHVQRLWRKGKFEFGFGVARFQYRNRAVGTRSTISFAVGWHFTENISLRYRHFSNMGSGIPNMGQDGHTLAWSF